MLDRIAPGGPVMVMRDRRKNTIVPPRIDFSELAAETEVCPKRDLPPMQPIWRYLDAYKFLDLIGSGTLYLTRVDKFQDGMEGLWSNGNLHCHTRGWDAFHAAYNVNENVTEMALQRLPVRERCYAVCWHINDREERKMWQSYAPMAESVSVKSRAVAMNYIAFRWWQRLGWQGITGCVEYVCHEDPRPEFISYAPAFYKDLSYRYEREFRLAVPWPHLRKQPLEYLRLPASPQTIIEEVIIHPHASDSFAQFIAARLRRVAPLAKVKRSGIRSRLW